MQEAAEVVLGIDVNTISSPRGPIELVTQTALFRGCNRTAFRTDRLNMAHGAEPKEAGASQHVEGRALAAP